MTQLQLRQAINQIKRRLAELRARTIEAIQVDDNYLTSAYEAERVTLTGLLYEYNQSYWDLIAMTLEGPIAVKWVEGYLGCRK